MELKEIQEHLRLHLLWVKGDKEGKRADLSGANLSEAYLFGANLSRANLSGADLSGANLSRANLFGASLSRANLFGASLSRANLSRANLSRANLSEANLSRANLSSTNLSETFLEKKAILSFFFGRHTACYFGNDELQIGCHKYKLEEWIQKYKEIGKKEGYSKDQIIKYGKFIKGCMNIYKETK